MCQALETTKASKMMNDEKSDDECINFSMKAAIKSITWSLKRKCVITPLTRNLYS